MQVIRLAEIRLLRKSQSQTNQPKPNERRAGVMLNSVRFVRPALSNYYDYKCEKQRLAISNRKYFWKKNPKKKRGWMWGIGMRGILLWWRYIVYHLISYSYEREWSGMMDGCRMWQVITASVMPCRCRCILQRIDSSRQLQSSAWETNKIM